MSQTHIVSFQFVHSLHACARFNPPAHIVTGLLELVPESPSCVDCMGRTPLHIAAGMRANLSTIQLLTDVYPAACAIPDKDGMTPLHLACDSACELFVGDEQCCEREPPSYDVVSMIINAWPSVVPQEDNYDRSALEYAILSGAPMKVVRLLQAVTINQTKKQAHEMSTKLVRRASQDSHDHGNEQQHQTIVSEPSEREHDPTKFDAAASTTTSMPAREEHLPSSRRGAIFLPYSLF